MPLLLLLVGGVLGAAICRMEATKRIPSFLLGDTYDMGRTKPWNPSPYPGPQFDIQGVEVNPLTRTKKKFRKKEGGGFEMNWAEMNKSARQVGPLIATFYPAAAPAVYAGMKATEYKSAQQEEKERAALIQRAKQGDKRAANTVMARKVGRSVKQNVAGNALADRIEQGDEAAIDTYEDIKRRALMGDRRAREEYTAVKVVLEQRGLDT